MKQIGICLMAMLLAIQFAAACAPANSVEIALNSNVTDETPGNYYKIDLAENTEYEVEMLSFPEEMKTMIRVLDAEGAGLASVESTAPGDNVSLTFETDEAGTYYVGVGEIRGKRCGPFMFRVNGPS